MKREAADYIHKHIARPETLGFLVLGRPALAALYQLLAEKYQIRLAELRPVRNFEYGQSVEFTIRGKKMVLVLSPNWGVVGHNAGNSKNLKTWSDVCWMSTAALYAKVQVLKMEGSAGMPLVID